MKNRGWNWVDVIQLFWHFREYCFHTIFSYRLKFCKESTRELNSVGRDWPFKVKAASVVVVCVFLFFFFRAGWGRADLLVCS